MNKLLERISKAPLALKIGVAVGLMALNTAVTAVVLVRPIEEKITKQATEQRTLDQQLLEKKSIAQNLNERRREMESLEQQLNEALTELPEKKEIDELLAQLNDVGRKSGLDIAKIEPAAEANADFYAKIPIKISVVGNYHEIAMFMQEISNLRRIVNVSSIELGSAELKNEKVVLDSKFLATTFRFLDQSQMQTDKKGGKKAAKPGNKG